MKECKATPAENTKADLFSKEAKLLTRKLGSFPASMEAGKFLDLYGSQPGFGKQQGAYAEALFEGITTWVQLPRDRWPEEREGKYYDPVSPFVLALYGHLDSGGLWEKHIVTGLRANKWRQIVEAFGKVCSSMMSSSYCWLSMWMISSLLVQLQTWKRAGRTSKVPSSTPESLGRYFGCERIEENSVMLLTDCHPHASPAVPHRTDYWEHLPEDQIWVRYHLRPRKKR